MLLFGYKDDRAAPFAHAIFLSCSFTDFVAWLRGLACRQRDYLLEPDVAISSFSGKALVAVGLSIVAAFSFSAVDTIVKGLMAGGMDALFAQGVRGWAVVLGIMIVMTIQNKQPDYRLIRPRAWIMWLRGLSMLIASVFMFVALAKIEQATVVAVVFLYPLLVGLLGALFLNEPIGPRRVAFILLGFVGVALAAGVTPATFQVWALLPAVAAVLISIQAVSVRWVSDRMSPLELSYVTTGVMAICGTPLLFLGSAGDLGWQHLGLFILVGGLSTLGTTSAAFAFIHAPMGLVSSLTYSSIIFSTMLAWFFFDEVPAVRVFIAMALIIVAGMGYLYYQHRAEVAIAKS